MFAKLKLITLGQWYSISAYLYLVWHRAMAGMFNKEQVPMAAMEWDAEGQIEAEGGERKLQVLN
jgi:hypothetical protein